MGYGFAGTDATCATGDEVTVPVVEPPRVQSDREAGPEHQDGQHEVWREAAYEVRSVLWKHVYGNRCPTFTIDGYPPEFVVVPCPQRLQGSKSHTLDGRVQGRPPDGSDVDVQPLVVRTAVVTNKQYHGVDASTAREVLSEAIAGTGAADRSGPGRLDPPI